MTETEALAELRRLARSTMWIMDAREVVAVLDQVDGTPVDPLPEVPGRGARVRVLFQLPDSEGGGTTAMDVLIVQRAVEGLWWCPADDAPSAEFTPWTRIEAITAA